MTQTASLVFIKEKIFDRVQALLPKDDWLVIGWVLATKILLFAFDVMSYQIVEDKRLEGTHPWLEIWNRWDALHYQALAQFGYDAKSAFRLDFYPFFPWCVRMLAWLTRDYLFSAFIVSGVASLFAAVLLRRLVARDYSSETALRTVWFLSIFPTAYFLHIGYTESLFLAVALGSFLAARNQRWLLAGVLGALCWMTRPTGMIVGFSLAIEAAYQWWQTKRFDWRWLWIALVPLGFGVFLFINWSVTGDAFTFLQIRKSVFIITSAWPWIGIREAYRNFYREPNQAEMVGVQEFLFVALGFICAVLSWIKLRPSYATWITGIWLLFSSATFIQSAPRHSVTMFPIFILFALAAANRFWSAVITIWSLLFLSLFASLFVRGWWAF
jgi:hypothetical protein